MRNGGEIREWKYAGEVGYQNNYRDYGIARNFGSGLKDWRTLLGTLPVLIPVSEPVRGNKVRIQENGGNLA